MKKHLKLGLIALGLLVLAASYQQPGPTVAAADDTFEGTVLTVTGQGKVALVPDTAYLTFGTVTQGTTAGEAQTANARLMEAVITALERAGVSKAFMSTSGFSLNPVWEHPRDKWLPSGEPAKPEIVGYQVRNSLSIRTHNLELLGHLIDVAVKAGANSVDGLRFGLKDPDRAGLDALEKAYQDARTRANTLARAAGMVVAGVKSIDVGGAYYPVYDGSLRMMAEAAPATPVLPGETEVTASVTVRFILK
jgi:uncharacterized protein YggE